MTVTVTLRQQILHEKGGKKKPMMASLPGDHGISCRAGADPLHLDASEVFDELDVVLGILGEILKGPDARCGRLPAGERLVDGLDLGQSVKSGGERRHLLPVNLVGNGSLDLVKVIENVQLCKVPRCVVVDGVRVLDNDQIEPTASSSAAGGDTKLATNRLHLLADLVDLLGGEGTAANSALVGLDHTNNLLELEGGNGKTGEDTTDTRVGRGDHGVGAPVNVQQQSVGTLDEHGGVVLLGALDKGNLINDKLGKARTPLIILLDLGLDVVLQQVTVALLVGRSHGPQLVVHVLLVEDLANADTRAGGLVLVAWADALLGGADGFVAKLDLLETIDERVQVEQGMGAVADVDAVLGVKTVLLQLLQLVEELGDADNTGAANEVGCNGVDQARRQDVEVVRRAVDNNGVAGIVTTS